MLRSCTLAAISSSFLITSSSEFSTRDKEKLHISADLLGERTKEDFSVMSWRRSWVSLNSAVISTKVVCAGS